MPRPALRSRIALVLLGLAAGIMLGRARRPSAARRSLGRGRHRVVIVGAGFGGLEAALDLRQMPEIELCLIDRHNHHLFQPLLYQVATAALSPGDIATPVRDAIAPAAPSAVRLGEVTGVDLAARHVICAGESVPYDTLVLATGSQPSYFGHDEWQHSAPGLKTLGDALALRQRILGAFERAAAHPPGSLERTRALTFVLIGGGATGVEMAGSIAELARDTLRRDFGADRDLQARVVLLDAGERVLAEFAPDLSRRAAAALEQLGVEIQTGKRVEHIEPGQVNAGGQTLAADTIIWAAGVEATPVAQWIGAKPGHGRQVPVGPDLTVAGHPEIFVIGDAALAKGRDGKKLPGLAPVAKQQGRYVARAIARRIRGGGVPPPFHYTDYGTLAAIGRNKAVAEFGRVHLSGFPAFATWAVAHIFFLITVRNRVLVGTQWALSYLTHQRSGRIIT